MRPRARLILESRAGAYFSRRSGPGRGPQGPRGATAERAAAARADPAAARVVREREQQEYEQPEEHRGDDDPDEPRAVAHVHEEEEHERHLRDGDGYRYHVVHLPEVDVRREDRDRREDEERDEDREVSFARYDLFGHILSLVNRKPWREKSRRPHRDSTTSRHGLQFTVHAS